MNYASILGISSTTCISIISGIAAVVCTGYLLMRFWREIAIGCLAIVMIAKIFYEPRIGQANPTTIEQIQIQNISTSVYEIDESSTYLDECISLTQKKDLCEEIMSQDKTDGKINNVKN